MDSEEKKSEQRARMEADVEAFLAAGGEVEQVDHTASKWYRDRHVKRLHVPMQVVPDRTPRPMHKWRHGAL